jgi:hypothetical protein
MLTTEQEMGEKWLQDKVISHPKYSKHKNPLRHIFNELNPDSLGDMLVYAYMAGRKETLQDIGGFINEKRPRITFSCPATWIDINSFTCD